MSTPLSFTTSPTQKQEVSKAGINGHRQEAGQKHGGCGLVREGQSGGCSKQERKKTLLFNLQREGEKEEERERDWMDKSNPEQSFESTLLGQAP